MDPDTILIIHFHSSRNTGDVAQLEATIEDLQSHFLQSRIILAANYPDEEYLKSLPVEVVKSISSLGGASKILPYQILYFFKLLIHLVTYAIIPKSYELRFLASKQWRRTLSAYEEANLVLSTPGNIFFSMGSFGYPFLLSALSILPALLLGKPFYVLPQTVGPISRWWERTIIKFLYKRAKHVFLREPQSLQFLHALGIPEGRTTLSLDPSLGSIVKRPSSPPSILVQAGFSPNLKAVGVTIIPRIIKQIHPLQLENYYRVLAQSISEFVIQHQLKVVFFPQVTGPMPNEDDRGAIHEVVNMLSCSENQIVVVDDLLSPSELKACYAWMDFFVATRLHSAVFSFACAVPTILIGYLPKTKAYAQLLNFQDYYLELSDLDKQDLTKLLNMLWENQKSIREEISIQIENLTNNRVTSGQLISQDFKNGE